MRKDAFNKMHACSFWHISCGKIKSAVVVKTHLTTNFLQHTDCELIFKKKTCIGAIIFDETYIILEGTLYEPPIINGVIW